MGRIPTRLHSRSRATINSSSDMEPLPLSLSAETQGTHWVFLVIPDRTRRRSRGPGALARPGAQPPPVRAGLFQIARAQTTLERAADVGRAGTSWRLGCTPARTLPPRRPGGQPSRTHPPQREGPARTNDNPAGAAPRPNVPYGILTAGAGHEDQGGAAQHPQAQMHQPIEAGGRGAPLAGGRQPIPCPGSAARFGVAWACVLVRLQFVTLPWRRLPGVPASWAPVSSDPAPGIRAADQRRPLQSIQGSV